MCIWRRRINLSKKQRALFEKLKSGILPINVENGQYVSLEILMIKKMSLILFSLNFLLGSKQRFI